MVRREERSRAAGRSPGRPRGCGLSLVAALAGIALAGCARPPEGPRNLLLITIDTLRADRLGCYGSASARTPVFDRLAREGTLFTDSFCSIPITLPSHCSIMTGLYPRNHGVLSHGYTLGPERTTLAEILKQNGYKTAAFISSHVLDDAYGTSQGFDIFWERYNYGAKRTKRLLLDEGEDILTKAATDWIRLEMSEPCFLWVHWFHPHKPYDPPPPMRAMVDPDPSSDRKADVKTLEAVWKGQIDLTPAEVERFRKLYEGEVAFTDRQIGLLLDRLQEAGVLENTIVLVTADHGEVLYEHERYFGHDIMLYEPSLRVPLVLRAPGIVPAGVVSNATVRSVDIVPTLLDLLHLPPAPGAIDGRSLAPALRGGDTGDPPVFAELFPPKKGWKSAPKHAVRHDGWKLITTDGSEETQLFDLTEDPAEAENRAGGKAPEEAKLRLLLREWMDGAPLPAGAYPELSDEERKNLRSLGYIEE